MLDGELLVHPVKSMSSGDVLSLVRANAFVVTLGSPHAIEPGTKVPVLFWKHGIWRSLHTGVRRRPARGRPSFRGVVPGGLVVRVDDPARVSPWPVRGWRRSFVTSGRRAVLRRPRKCLVSSTTNEEKGTLVKWIFSIAALHPAVSSVSAVTDVERTELNKATASLFETVLADRCKKQTKDAVKYEGTNTIQEAFGVLGQRRTPLHARSGCIRISLVTNLENHRKIGKATIRIAICHRIPTRPSAGSSASRGVRQAVVDEPEQQQRDGDRGRVERREGQEVEERFPRAPRVGGRRDGAVEHALRERLRDVLLLPPRGQEEHADGRVVEPLLSGVVEERVDVLLHGARL